MGLLYVDGGAEQGAEQDAAAGAPAPTGRGDEPVLCLVGDVDLANAAGHGDELCAVLDALDTNELRIDCSRLDLLESQGMAMMVRVHRHGAERGIDVVWCALAPRHHRVLELTGLGDYLRLEPEAPAAV